MLLCEYDEKHACTNHVINKIENAVPIIVSAHRLVNE